VDSVELFLSIQKELFECTQSMEWMQDVHQVKFYVHVKPSKLVAYVALTGPKATTTQPD
jgi:hypothetical protein